MGVSKKLLNAHVDECDLNYFENFNINVVTVFMYNYQFGYKCKRINVGYMKE